MTHGPLACHSRGAWSRSVAAALAPLPVLAAALGPEFILTYNLTLK